MGDPARSETLERVPPHLRHHVVEQDYGAYTAIDQAVWRFILLQLRARLSQAAHPAYAHGFEATGMSAERIPRIEEMDTRLGELGWGAVCVDGFIPPRAFQELQALGILPIAADIRRLEHLPYTPAPDIVHEAAGHAPILPDPAYAAFLRRIGDVGMRAFTLPVDGDVYDAIYALSVAKEQRDAGDPAVVDAEHMLAEALARASQPSEAGRLARLYWWTVEYGLVGALDDFRLYGAGLLSSLGESHFCHSPEVAKLLLDAGCVDVGYDITQRQPQLFVAQDFDHVAAVLEEVSTSMAFRTGGLAALETARASGEVATLELEGGLQVIGRVTDVRGHRGEACLVELAGPVALAREGRLLAMPKVDGTVRLPLGLLEDGSDPARLEVGSLRARCDAAGRLSLRNAGGVRVEGAPRGLDAPRDPAVIELHDARVVVPGARPESRARQPLLLASRVVGVRAGACDPDYWPPERFARVTAPARPVCEGPAAELLSLYARAQAAHEAGELERVLADVHSALTRRFPRDWLLRWNLLESLGRRPTRHALEAVLVEELRDLEHVHGGAHPIASGLRYLGHAP